MSGKNSLPYYKRYPRDFIEGTIGLDLELKGAYSILLDLIYMQGGKLPDDERYISGLLGCRPAKWKRIRDLLLSMEKIEVRGGKITNSRANLELNALRSFSETQSKNASQLRKNNDLGKATAKPSLSQPEPEPEPIKKEPSVPKKGMRIPDDFEPDLEWAMREGLSLSEARTEAANFRDFWSAKTGKDATKLDWPATWRTWVRNGLKRKRAPPAGVKSDYRRHQEEVDRSFREAIYGTGHHNDDDGQPAFELEPGNFRSDRSASAGKR